MSDFEKCPNDVTDERLLELAELVKDPHLVLGPIDQQDVRQSLIELAARRASEVALQAEAPQVQAA